MAAEFKPESFVGGEHSLGEWYDLSKDELRLVADHLGVEIPPGTKKGKMIETLVCRVGGEPLGNSTRQQTSALEVQRLTLEEVKVREKAETERARISLEKMKMELEVRKLESEDGKRERKFEVGRNICLVPKFCEQEVDVFFSSFEKVANSLSWPTKYWSLLAQSALTGRAQEVYAALEDEQAADYRVVKERVLLVYELVPESYRQRFRGLQRREGQTQVEFARQKEVAFERWCRAQKVDQDYSKLRQLVLIEEFKNSIAPEVRVHLEDHKVDNLQRAAILADEYELAHRPSFGSRLTGHAGYQEAQGSNKMWGPSGGLSGPTCHYCRRRGHVKAECWKKQRDEGQEAGVK